MKLYKPEGSLSRKNCEIKKEIGYRIANEVLQKKDYLS